MPSENSGFEIIAPRRTRFARRPVCWAFLAMTLVCPGCHVTTSSSGFTGTGTTKVITWAPAGDVYGLKFNDGPYSGETHIFVVDGSIPNSQRPAHIDPTWVGKSFELETTSGEIYNATVRDVTREMYGNNVQVPGGKNEVFITQ
jgi:hypothetical protein